MKIAAFFTVRKSNGGAYQYAVTFLEVLKSNPEHSYVIFNYSPDLPAEFENLINFEVVHFAEKDRDSKPKPKKDFSLKALSIKIKIIIHYVLLRLHLFSLLAALTRKSQQATIRKITSRNIDLVIFTMTNKLAFLLDLPTIVPIHDINHKLHPQYPEMSQGKTWAQREYITSQTTKRASKILVDSQVSREDMITHYNTDPDKLVILPFLPPSYLTQNVSSEKTKAFFEQHQIPEKFLFYPAQLWAHKNHINLVKAISVLKSKGLDITLILTGAKKKEFGILDKITNFTKAHGIENQVKFLGFVEDDEITMLYQNATAMAMPALVGPTYIPIYEAWSMGCPILCSSIRGLRDQAGDAALLFDPTNPKDIADKIEQIWENESLRQNLIDKGKKRLGQWTEEDFRARINQLIDSFKSK
jgi:glycosyltransferase involved in cell wall biosynthesis